MGAPILEFGAVVVNLGLIPTKMVNVQMSGAKGDGETDDTAVIQDALDDPKVNTVVFPEALSYYKISQPLTISQPKTLVFLGGQKSKLCQTRYEYPVFYVAGAANVSFLGQVVLENLGAPYHIQARIAGVPVEYSGSPNVFSAGITCSGKVDNLYIEDASVYNFACGVVLANSVTSDVTYSENVRIDNLYAEDCWCGLLGGGVISMHVETVIGKNMVRTQGVNPEHVVYIGQRDAALDHHITFGRVIGRDCVGGGAVFQAKTVQRLSVDTIMVDNCVSAVACYKVTTGQIGQVLGSLADSAAMDTGAIYVFDTCNITIGKVALTTAQTLRVANPGTSVLLVTTTSTVTVSELFLRLTAAADPARAVRASTTGTINLHTVHLEYTAVPTINAIHADEGRIYVYRPPVLKGTNKLFQVTNVGGTADHLLRLDPNLIDGQMSSSVVIVSNNIFNIDFAGMDNDPPTNVGNTCNLRSINVVRATTGDVALIKFQYGSPYQIYTLLCATNGYAPQVNHNDAAGNIILRSGANYAANSWKVLRFIYLPDGKFYEI